jgi:hypothetical protein
MLLRAELQSISIASQRLINSCSLASSASFGKSSSSSSSQEQPAFADDARLQELIKRWDAIEMLWSSALRTFKEFVRLLSPFKYSVKYATVDIHIFTDTKRRTETVFLK